MIAAGLPTTTGLPSAAGLAAGLLTAAGDGLPTAGGEGLALGLAVGASWAIIAVGVAIWGEPTGVGGLDTFIVGDAVSELLLQATMSTLSAAISTNR